MTVASIFDPSGLISAYVIKYKLFQRDVSLDKKIGWSDPLPTALMNRWRSLTKELVCIPPIIINRCAQPPNVLGKPKLAVFLDGSSVAYAVVIYAIFEVSQEEAGPWSSGLGSKKTFDSRLLLAKARVAPLSGMTVPCTKMNSLVLATKLLDVALVSMSEPPTSVTCCLDSECTISAVESEKGLLKPYLANRRAVVIGKFQE